MMYMWTLGRCITQMLHKQAPKPSQEILLLSSYRRKAMGGSWKLMMLMKEMHLYCEFVFKTLQFTALIFILLITG